MIDLRLRKCEIALKKLDDNSVDAIVTDPPYGIRFMNRKWDYDIPGVDVWQECLRILKPGGHLLCFCGTRTQHRMTVNIENAGFEVRDICAWVYGSGFPKSLNIGKAVDKLHGNERIELGNYIAPDGNKRNNNKLGTEYNTEMITGFKKDRTITMGNSPFEGWGTALKPAMELITLARKPLSEKTVAENVLKWGTGGLNIDRCRIKMKSKDKDEYINKRHSFKNMTGRLSGGWACTSPQLSPDEFIANSSQGRWPANFIHDGSNEVMGLFPDAGKTHGGRNGKQIKNALFPLGGKYQNIGDSGSAARFFYCAKASRNERNNNGTVDNNHPTVKPLKLMRYLCRLITPLNGTIVDPYMGSGTTGVAAKMEGFKFIGIEKDNDSFEIAKKRIHETQLILEV